jgi:High potential iron-sulfur protein
MKDLLSRRQALMSLAFGAGALLATGTVAADAAKPAAGGPPHVGAGDPMAVALAYVENAQNIDVKKMPSYKPGQNCANCLQSVGKDGDAWVGCKLFQGKVVSAQGWCRGYGPKQA